jgi:hypothetical protein
MSLPIKLISTDFDGTLFAEFESPPIPEPVQNLIGDLQSRGAKWVINTGRDMSSLGAGPLIPGPITLGGSGLPHRLAIPGLRPEWRLRRPRELFARVRRSPHVAWIGPVPCPVTRRLFALLLIAGNNGDADVIHDSDGILPRHPPWVVRNNLCALHHRRSTKPAWRNYAPARLSPERFLLPETLNDLPMLSLRHARWLAAPGNAVAPVKQAVREQGGHVSELPHGDGVAEGLEFCLASAQRLPGSRV